MTEAGMEMNVRTIVQTLKGTNLVWRYGRNFTPTVQHRFAGNTQLGSAENAVLNKLDSDGIAVTSIDELFSDNSEFLELSSETSRLLESRKEEITTLKSSANNEQAVGSKTFNLEVFGSELTIKEPDVFVRFALNNSFLTIANAYFGMIARLRYYNVWQTFASQGTARESQLWHFDREDRYILKMFLYLEDVDEGSGPFTYAPGTHKKGRDHGIKPEFFLEGGVKRTTDEQMSTVFPEKKWVTGTGKKGTLIFADTRGYHKGGEARTKDRLTYTCMFTSPASESRNLLNISASFDGNSLEPGQRLALGIK